jgi:hypothetical protein
MVSGFGPTAYSAKLLAFTRVSGPQRAALYILYPLLLVAAVVRRVGPPARMEAMKPILDHLDRIVRPGLRRYAEAEAALTKAHAARDGTAIDAARIETGLAARQAVDGLHHLADFMWKEPDCWPRAFANLEDVRSGVESRCLFLRNAQVPVKDVTLLRDVSVAFKHHRPTRGAVAVSTDILPEPGGYGSRRWGEGKWGGVEETVVTTKDGAKRALSSVLQNVFDAWMGMLGLPQNRINEF